MLFLSTPSARRATQRLRHRSCGLTNFYPRPPRGGRPWPTLQDLRFWAISIHALREEGDNLPKNNGGKNHEFLSTPSARRATIHS